MLWYLFVYSGMYTYMQQHKIAPRGTGFHTSMKDMCDAGIHHLFLPLITLWKIPAPLTKAVNDIIQYTSLSVFPIVCVHFMFFYRSLEFITFSAEKLYVALCQKESPARIPFYFYFPLPV